MRVLGPFGWILVALAFAMSALAAWSLARLPLVPPPIAPLAGDSIDFIDWKNYWDTHEDHALVTVAAPDAVIAVANRGAFRIGRDLRVQRYPWPAGAYVGRIRSLAWNAGTLAVSYGSGFQRGDEDGVLVIAPGRLARVPVEGPARLTGLRAQGGGFVGFLVDYNFHGTRLLSIVVELDGLRVSSVARVVDFVGPAVEGVTWIDDEPWILLSQQKTWTMERLVGAARPTPEGKPVWSASAVDAAPDDEPRLFLDERGGARSIAPPSSGEPLRFCVAAGALEPLETTVDKTGALVRCGGRSLALGWPKSRRGRLAAGAPGGPLHDVSSNTYVSEELSAQPLDGAWLLVQDLHYSGEGALVADDGTRLDRPSGSTAMKHAGHPSIDWLVIVLLLFAFTCATPVAILIVWLRARRWRLDRRAGAEVGVPGIFVGTLRRDSDGEESVAIGAHDVRLTPGYRVLGRPLPADGGVFVVGRIEETAAGEGPFRAGAAERRFVPDGKRYAIGRWDEKRGGPLPLPVPGRAALRWLLFAYFTAGVLLLVRFGFDPLFW